MICMKEENCEGLPPMTSRGEGHAPSASAAGELAPAMGRPSDSGPAGVVGGAGGAATGLGGALPTAAWADTRI